VISILRKKRQRVTGYDVLLSGERKPDYPRRYTRIEMVHRLRGFDLDRAAIEDAIRLSETKYCSVRSSLKDDLEVLHQIEIVAESPAPPAQAPSADAAAAGSQAPVAARAPEPAPAMAGASVAVQAPLSPRFGLSELILRVANVPRAVAFYRDVVGLAVESIDSEQWAWLWSGTRGSLPRLGLTSRPLSFGAAHTGGPAHFAIGVPRSAIPAEKARLESLGIEVEGPITFDFWKADSIYFSDLDRNRVELCGFEHLDTAAKRSGTDG